MKSVFIILLSFLTFSLNAQLQINTTGTPAQWVQNVLVGTGIQVSNVTYTGDLQSIGTFTTGANPTSLGFSEGLILSTGDVNDAPGPNSSGSTGSATSGGSDPQLAPLITQTVNDAAVLEFDFIPLSDTIKFEYIFASDEYPEFVNSINDVFGFFLTGFTPTGGQYNNTNIAILPNSSTIVSINTVNNGNSNTGPCVNCAYYNHNNGSTIEYDASTVTLTAWATVIPCVSYHVKLAVGDAQDEIYDSAVFFKANSFSSLNVAVSQTVSNFADTTASEGCTDSYLTLKIPYTTSTDLPLYFLMGGSATNGVDYTTINSPAIVPAGSDSVTITIHPLLDGITEGVEEIIFVIATSPCTVDSVSVFINDNDSLAVDVFNDTLLCNGASDTLFAVGSGLIGPYNYLWSTGDTIDYIVVSPSVTTTYSVTASGKCVADTTSSVVVEVSTPVYTLDGDSICPGESAEISVQSAMNLTYQWNTGETSDTITHNTSSTQFYYVTATDAMGCSNDDSIQVHVFPSPNVQISNDKYICEGTSAVLVADGGTQYEWSSGETTATISVSPSTSQTYFVTVKNSGDCAGFDTVDVFVVDNPIAEITALDDTVCMGGSTELTVSGGTSFLWPQQASSASTISVTPSGVGRFYAIAMNSDGGTVCRDSTSIAIPAIRCNKIFLPSAFSPNGDGLNEEFKMNGEYDYLEDFEMFVYDRTGNVVFHTSNPDKGWDGKINDQEPITGVYTYVIYIKEAYLDDYTLRGTITLVK